MKQIFYFTTRVWSSLYDASTYRCFLHKSYSYVFILRLFVSFSTIDIWHRVIFAFVLVTDQSPFGPRTHGRGQLRTSQSDQKTHRSPLLRRRGSIRRKHKSPTSGSDTTRKPVNRFRPPNKRKNWPVEKHTNKILTTHTMQETMHKENRHPSFQTFWFIVRRFRPNHIDFFFHDSIYNIPSLMFVLSLFVYLEDDLVTMLIYDIFHRVIVIMISHLYITH